MSAGKQEKPAMRSTAGLVSAAVCLSVSAKLKDGPGWTSEAARASQLSGAAEPAELSR